MRESEVRVAPWTHFGGAEVGGKLFASPACGSWSKGEPFPHESLRLLAGAAARQWEVVEGSVMLCPLLLMDFLTETTRS